MLNDMSINRSLLLIDIESFITMLLSQKNMALMTVLSNLLGFIPSSRLLTSFLFPMSSTFHLQLFVSSGTFVQFTLQISSSIFLSFTSFSLSPSISILIFPQFDLTCKWIDNLYQSYKALNPAIPDRQISYQLNNISPLNSSMFYTVAHVIYFFH